MFESRSDQPELMDDLSLTGDALRKNLDELELVNKYLGGNQVVTDALKQLLRSHSPNSETTWHVGDIGCGGGDLLREMSRWAGKRNVKLQLDGIDANPFMVNYAREKATDYPDISFREGNLYDPDFQAEKFELITCSLFCHHFTDEQLIPLLAQWQKQARVAVIINDLHRHWLAYWSIWAITRILNGSYLVKHDAPLSVARAFRRSDLVNLLAKAGIREYKLRWMWAFRFQLIIPGTG